VVQPVQTAAKRPGKARVPGKSVSERAAKLKGKNTPSRPAEKPIKWWIEG
jgi:hypothetical protein